MEDAGTTALSSGATSWLYVLERFDVGLVQLDGQMRVVSMNEFARNSLPVDQRKPFGQLVTAFHAGASRAKVEFMIKQSECPVVHTAPMTMLINIPERMLLIKVSRMVDERGETSGYTLFFHDITEVISQVNRGAAVPELEHGAGPRRLLRKIPTTHHGRVLLVDVAEMLFVRSDGHYTWIHTAEGANFCNLTISDIASRLDPSVFLRVHRSYIVNLQQVNEFVREDGRIMLRMKGTAENDSSGRIPVSRSSTAALLEQLGLIGVPQLIP
jgi:LytTR family transcriptional regulator, CO-responsive transcriptional regulator RcoM